MKAIYRMALLGIALTVISLQSYGYGKNSEVLDASPSLVQARQAALDFAYEVVFSEVLDEGSKVSIFDKAEDKNGFDFTVTASTPPQNCIVEIRVSKGTGVAFNNEAMVCN